ncbi:hydrogenase nickel incorporation protein HypB [Xanthobacter sp. VNH20]|uniref:hydrogenase nickel incorporation protein HypB n=1 Tax=Xanthobacter sp. VNH20 TaxID=3156616 RepID=UPI0032B490F5
MCVACGCGSDAVTLSGPDAAQTGEGAHTHSHDAGAHSGPHHGHAHGHSHAHDHGHDDAAQPQHSHAPGLDARRMVEIEQNILAKNDGFAAQNRARLAADGIFALNLLAGPGAGKTTLLVETLKALSGRVAAAVIEGDQQTANDAERIRAVGFPAVQINTGKGCHLDAHMVGHALERLPLPAGGILFIENVGNLVCPAAFDLGEDKRITLLSVTEGEDKPLKYPDIFQDADLVLLTKADLLPHLDVDFDTIVGNVGRINPTARVIALSSRSGVGFGKWLAWLEDARRTRLEQLARVAEERAQALRGAFHTAAE